MKQSVILIVFILSMSLSSMDNSYNKEIITTQTEPFVFDQHTHAVVKRLVFNNYELLITNDYRIAIIHAKKEMTISSNLLTTKKNIISLTFSFHQPEYKEILETYNTTYYIKRNTIKLKDGYEESKMFYKKDLAHFNNMIKRISN